MAESAFITVPESLVAYLDKHLPLAREGIADHKQRFEANRAFFPEVSNQLAWNFMDEGIKLAENIQQALAEGQLSRSHIEELYEWCRGTERRIILEFMTALQKSAKALAADNDDFKARINQAFPIGSSDLNELMRGLNEFLRMMDGIDMKLKMVNPALYKTIEQGITTGQYTAPGGL